MKDEIRKQIMIFVQENNPYSNKYSDNSSLLLCWKQIQSLITAYAILFDLEVDTREYDELIQDVFHTMVGAATYDTYSFNKVYDYLSGNLV